MSVPLPVSPVRLGYKMLSLSGKDSKVQGLTVQFSPRFIQSVMQPGVLRGTRHELSLWSELEERLLWDGHLSLQGQRVAIQAWLGAAPELEGKNLIRVRLVAERKLKKPVRLILVWAGQTHISEFAADEAEFEDISLPDFDNYSDDEPCQDFSLTIESLVYA